MNNFDDYTDDEFFAQIDESVEFEMDENTFNNDDFLNLEYN